MADNPSSAELEKQIMNLNISNNISCTSEVIGPQATSNDDSNNDDIKNSSCDKPMAVKTKIIHSDNQKSKCDIVSSKNKNFRCNEKSLDQNDTILLSDDDSVENIDDHDDIVVISDDNESDWEDIDDNDGDSINTVLSSDNDGLDNIDDPDFLTDDSDWEDIDDNDDTAVLSDDNGVKNIDNHVDTAVLSDDNNSDQKDIDDNDDTILSSDASSSISQEYTLLIDPILLTPNVEHAKIYNFLNSNPLVRIYLQEPTTLLDNIEEYDKNEIVEIVDSRYFRNESFYLVKWKNWSRGFNTWEPFRALQKSQEHILEFEKKKIISNKSINLLHLIVTKYVITQLFDSFRTYNGLSLPITTFEYICSLSEDIDQNSEHVDLLRKLCLKLQLDNFSLEFFRGRQERELKQWEKHINFMSQSYNIKVENNMDLEGPPISFAYLLDCFIPEGKIIIPDNPPSGCLCKKDCSFYMNCCKTLSGSVAYDLYENVLVTPDYPIFECNKNCSCTLSCINRVVQHGSKAKVCIYKSKYPGWALKTYQNIDKGQFVGIFVGEIITVEEYYQRLLNSSSSIDYIWKLDFNDKDNFKCIVDGTHYGNFTRFINHSCEANLSIYSVWIDCLDRYFPHLALFANRNILAGEQLTTDYFISRGKDSLKKSGIRCQCESKKCKGYYF